MGNFENIPAELKLEKAWVNVWKNSKIPMQTRFRKAASAIDSTTWGTYEDAVSNVTNASYDGIGYVFHGTGLVGIDCDCGFDSDGFLSDIAIDLITSARSYTEKSRSGRGIHILVKGILPFAGKNNRMGVEIYSSSRYFIVTGEKLIYDKIIENQEAIDYIVEKYFSEVEKENESTGSTGRIYSPHYAKPEKGKIVIQPTYPPIPQGIRNLSLTSLAGQLHKQGYGKKEIYMELLKANQAACKPPLPVGEIQTIVNSVTKYRR